MTPEDFRNKKILVAGLGKSGIAVVNLLLQKGYDVSAYDNNRKAIDNPEVKKLIEAGVQITTGSRCDNRILNSDLIVLSPGIDQREKVFLDARKNGAIVTGELELAWSFLEKPIVAVTGTNGKSTVTELIADILEYSGKKVFRGGNLGTPLSEAVLNQDLYQVMVVEVSSFQIDTIVDFRPDVAILLNVTHDHLDRYDDFERYKESKLNLFKNQKDKDTAVLNATDFIHLETNSAKSFFNIDDKQRNSALAKDNRLIINFNGRKETIDISSFSLKGVHNLENLSGAAISALEAGADIEGIKKAVTSFKGLPHRMEYIGSIGKIDFINDSKATNPDSVFKAIQGLDIETSLIMGGKDKGYDYCSLSEMVNQKIKNLILIGETRKKIHKEIDFRGRTIFEDSMDKAVESAFENLGQKGLVLLSPACSSFDMFKGYGERGDVFKSSFLKLKKRIGADSND